jgi:hypothetical protein
LAKWRLHNNTAQRTFAYATSLFNSIRNLQIFMNCYLRAREEVKWHRGKLYNEGFHTFYFSSHVIRIIKWKRLRWAEKIARMGDIWTSYTILVRNLNVSEWLEDVSVDMRKICLHWTEWKCNGLIHLRTRSSVTGLWKQS